MELRRKIPATPIAPSEARVIARTLKGVIPPPVVDDLEVIVSELATNVLQHSGLRPDDSFEVRMSLDSSKLRVEVWDEGLLDIARDAQQSEPEPLLEGGRGLQLVEALSSRWSVEKIDGTAAWAEIDLPTMGA